MNRIVMYSSSSDLRAGLHRLLALAALDPAWEEGRPWWSALRAPERDAARCGELNLETLADRVVEQLSSINRVRARLGLSEPLCLEIVTGALRRARISWRAHRAHGGRDVYGASNKAVWDLLVAPIAEELRERWGEVAVAPGVLDGRRAAPPEAIASLASTLVAHRTGPRDDGHVACARWLTDRLTDQGFEVKWHEADGFPPVLEATRPPIGLAGHVVMYGHYDTVRAGRQWTTDPDQLTEAEGRWWARGISDNKGPLAVRLWALGQLSRSPRLTWLLQGEEETGSRHSRNVLRGLVPDLRAELFLDETGYHDHEDGTLRLIARRVGSAPDPALLDWLDGLRLLAARRGLASRFEERGLNKSQVAGGCPFDQAIPVGARVLAMGVNDSAAGIHAANESLPTWTFDLHREQLALLFHGVDRLARESA